MQDTTNETPAAFPATRRRPLLVSLAAAFGAAVRTSRAQADDAWPTRPITLVVSTKAGGGFDLMARTLAPSLSRELGVPVSVLNREGGAMMIGTVYSLQQPHDGNTILISGPAPYWYADIHQFHAKFSLKDFTIVNVQWTDRSCVFVPAEGRLQSLQDIIAALKAEPGKVSAGVVRDSGEFYNLGILREGFKLPPQALRLVTYEDSAELRTAIAGGQLDFAVVSLESSVGMFKLMKPVAIYGDTRAAEFADLPTVSEVLKPYGVSIDIVPSSLRCVVVPSDLQTRYPDRYTKLVAAYSKILHDPDFIASCKAKGVATDWFGPEKSQQVIETAFATLDRYSYLLTQK